MELHAIGGARDDGFLEAVRAVDPTIRALILTSFDDEQALTAAVLAGAQGLDWEEQVSGYLTELYDRGAVSSAA